MGFVFLFVMSVVFIQIIFTPSLLVRFKLKKNKRKNISSFKSGDVGKVVGEIVMISSPVSSPLAHQTCATYHFRVTIHDRIRIEKTVFEEYGLCKFLIKSEGGYVYINADKIKTGFKQISKTFSDCAHSLTEELQTFLLSKDIPLTWFRVNMDYHIEEQVLMNGARVAVLGIGEYREASELNLPKKYGKVLEMTPIPYDVLYLSDFPSTMN